MNGRHAFRSQMGLLAGTLFCAALTLAGPSQAGNAFSQAACPLVNGTCLSFNNTDPISLVRSFTFKMAKPGKAVVQFHGAIYCQLTGSAAATVDLESRITANDQELVFQSELGGNPVVMVLKQDTVVPMNLASTRLISYNSAGRKTVAFKLKRNQMGAGTACHIKSAYFTVMTFP